MPQRTKHTPGPWTSIVRNDASGIVSYIGPQDKFSSDDIIATVECNAGDANARLIAAAPELLEACLASLAEWSQYDGANAIDGPTERARIKLMSQLKTAIAKATGVEP